MKSIWLGPRREMCHRVGLRASMLSPDEAAIAWAFLARDIEGMGELDVPKFSDLITTIRAATIVGRQKEVDESRDVA